MDQPVTYRVLFPSDMSQMYRSFVEAFSQYTVKMSMSREAFERRMLYKLNIIFELSVGAFAGDKLVGFVFHTVADYEGGSCAYNGGTGIVPMYSGKGFSKKLYDFIIPVLKKAGVEKCVLEVLTSNDRALRAYQNIGFHKTKSYQCLLLRGELKEHAKAEGIELKVVSAIHNQQYLELTNVASGMLDQLSQVPFNMAYETVLEAREIGVLIGYIIFQPTNGRISQIAVTATHRRQGVGSMLLRYAYEKSKPKKLSILNIESNHFDTTSFFVNAGFDLNLLQLEMQKNI